MESGLEAKNLEHAGYLPSATLSPTVLPASLRLVSRFLAPIALILAVATIVGGLVFYLDARSSDDRADVAHRAALRAGIEKFSLAMDSDAEPDAASMRLLEQFSGVSGLKWETEPQQSMRDVQSVVDANGRILGWLSWEPDRPMTDAAIRLLPWLSMASLGLLFLAALSRWQTRRLETEFAATEARAHTLSKKDGLTGLYNTGSTLETLEQALIARAPDEIVTYIFVDLSGFRDLNDSLSRPWGNEFLIAAAARLTSILPPGSPAGRLGRHKFGIILRPKTPGTALRIAEEIADQLSRPFRIQGQGVQIRCSVGVAHAPRDGLNADELVRHATLAMRAAKRTKSGAAMAFEPAMAADLKESRFLESELKRALDSGGLDIHYQPIVTAEGSSIIGVEALLRWPHPTRGNIPPMTFVPVAEQTGLMGQLGEFVLRRALKDAKRWPDLYMAVNLSPLQVRDRALFTLVSAVLKETGIEPSRVVLEITEGVLIDDPEEMRKRLEELHSLGLRLALDDFGAGYSSLSYLQHFPFDKLKIDRGFVSPLGRSPNSGVIVQAIVSLGQALGLSVLVEGVETEEQRVLLRLAGCDEMQGFLFARPAPREWIDKLLLEAKQGGGFSVTEAAAAAERRASGF